MESGILLLDKERDVTSRYVDNALMKKFHTRHVGHLGTLDPFATGLLVIAINKGTKFLPFLEDEPKTYEATLRLGASSSTGDTEGEIKELENVPSLSLKTIQETLKGFLGKGEQLPPMTSAIKVDGVPLYKYAHKGETKERKVRPIFIYSIELLSFANNNLSFRVSVSSGTYIRVLGEDIAKKLGTEGYLVSLRRTEIAGIPVFKAKKLEDIEESDIQNPVLFMNHLPKVEAIDSTQVKNGVKLDLKKDYGDKVLLMEKGTPLAVYERVEGTTYRSLRGLF